MIPMECSRSVVTACVTKRIERFLQVSASCCHSESHIKFASYNDLLQLQKMLGLEVADCYCLKPDLSDLHWLESGQLEVFEHKAPSLQSRFN